MPPKYGLICYHCADRRVHTLLFALSLLCEARSPCVHHRWHLVGEVLQLLRPTPTPCRVSATLAAAASRSPKQNRLQVRAYPRLDDALCAQKLPGINYRCCATGL